MAKEIKTRDYVWKCRGEYGHSINKKGEAPYVYLDGHVATPYGYVAVFTTVDAKKGDQYTTFDLIWRGFIHRRLIEREVSERYLKTLAKRFAKEIAENNP